MQIWKTACVFSGVTEAEYPGPMVRVVHWEFIDGRPFVWVECDPSSNHVSTREFKIVGTGHEYDAGWIPIRHSVVQRIAHKLAVWHMLYRNPDE